MKHIIPTFVAVGIVAMGIALAQQAPLPIQDMQVLPLWSGPAPGAQGTAETDIPKITVWLPGQPRPE
jgi:hypothetical protein